ncbi:MAG: hypothetical protein MR704_22925 [Clostridia bacterium]|nr:hypothetical protein [Clostridia bacterium]
MIEMVDWKAAARSEKIDSLHAAVFCCSGGEGIPRSGLGIGAMVVETGRPSPGYRDCCKKELVLIVFQLLTGFMGAENRKNIKDYYKS